MLSDKLEGYITVPDAAKIKSCSDKVLYESAKNGRLDSIRLGRTILIVDNEKWTSFDLLKKPTTKGKKLRQHDIRTGKIVQYSVAKDELDAGGYISVDEAAKIKNCSRVTIHYAFHKQRINGIQTSRAIFILPDMKFDMWEKDPMMFERKMGKPVETKPADKLEAQDTSITHPVTVEDFEEKMAKEWHGDEVVGSAGMLQETMHDMVLPPKEEAPVIVPDDVADIGDPLISTPTEVPIVACDSSPWDELGTVSMVGDKLHFTPLGGSPVEVPAGTVTTKQVVEICMRQNTTIPVDVE